jgi:two-component system NtrC family sensor kinase
MPDSESVPVSGYHNPPPIDAARTSEGFSRQDEEFKDAADRALRERPYFSIRTRLVLAFSIFFLLPLVITLWTMHVLASVHEKILFLELADDYKVEIQQARRFEKNFLLYGTNLEDAREHAQAAQHLSAENAEQFRKVVGEDSLRTMEGHLSAYLRLLDEAGQGERGVWEAELREHGAAMFKLAQDFVSRERKQVHTMLALTRRVPFYFLGVLFVVMVVVLTFLARHIMKSLNRFMGYTRRIGSGDFSPITPTRGYRDEFTDLALNINRMVRELDRHHGILLESHKLRAMGTLVAGVAHELNNPMNNILLTASLLQEDCESLKAGERDEMLQDLVDQADRTKRIVANLLNFARQSETKVEGLDMREIVEEITRLVGNQIRIKKVRLIVDVPEELPTVHGDRQLLGQVFTNLILNALDVLPEKGEIRISFDTEHREGFLAVNVTDNGPGIPDHIMSRIFDPFFTTKPKGKGTGLGLSVSKGIVRKLGGYLLVESELGVGSTFTVLLPITTIPSDISARAGGSDGGR